MVNEKQIRSKSSYPTDYIPLEADTHSHIHTDIHAKVILGNQMRVWFNIAQLDLFFFHFSFLYNLCTSCIRPLLRSVHCVNTRNDTFLA